MLKIGEDVFLFGFYEFVNIFTIKIHASLDRMEIEVFLLKNGDCRLLLETHDFINCVEVK